MVTSNTATVTTTKKEILELLENIIKGGDNQKKYFTKIVKEVAEKDKSVTEEQVSFLLWELLAEYRLILESDSKVRFPESNEDVE